MVPAKAEADAKPSTFSLGAVLTVLRGLGFTSARVLPTESSRTTGVKSCSIKRALASSLRLGLVARQLRSGRSSLLANLSCKWDGGTGFQGGEGVAVRAIETGAGNAWQCRDQQQAGGEQCFE